MSVEPDTQILRGRGHRTLAKLTFAALLSVATGAACAIGNGANVSTDVGYRSPTGP